MVLELFLLMGIMGVASNPSPYYAALGLVWGGGAGCLVLVKWGVTFLSLVLFLVYLGGMMVVFAYSAALVAEPYPKAWGSNEVVVYLGVYICVLVISWISFGGGMVELGNELGGEVVLLGWWGVSVLFWGGGWMLVTGGWALLLTLFVALEVVGFKYGALRAV